jgi:hypothetical protein
MARAYGYGATMGAWVTDNYQSSLLLAPLFHARYTAASSPN